MPKNSAEKGRHDAAVARDGYVLERQIGHMLKRAHRGYYGLDHVCALYGLVIDPETRAVDAADQARLNEDTFPQRRTPWT